VRQQLLAKTPRYCFTTRVRLSIQSCYCCYVETSVHTLSNFLPRHDITIPHQFSSHLLHNRFLTSEPIQILR